MTARPKAAHFVAQIQNCSRLHSCPLSLSWCTRPNDGLFSSMQRTECVSLKPLASFIKERGIREHREPQKRSRRKQMLTHTEQVSFRRRSPAITPNGGSVFPLPSFSWSFSWAYKSHKWDIDLIWKGQICSGLSSRKGGLNGWSFHGEALAAHCAIDWLSWLKPFIFWPKIWVRLEGGSRLVVLLVQSGERA